MSFLFHTRVRKRNGGTLLHVRVQLVCIRVQGNYRTDFHLLLFLQVELKLESFDIPFSQVHLIKMYDMRMSSDDQFVCWGHVAIIFREKVVLIVEWKSPT